jgi:hypothetical protein
MSEFTRSDMLRIKWSFVAMTVSIMAIIGLFAGLKALDTRATKTLAEARADNQKWQEKLDKFSQEKESIIRNKDRYQIIKQGNIVGQEDRLQMYEHFQQLRADYNLSTIEPTISKQAVVLLPYGVLDGKRVDKPGRPISLQISNVAFKLSLLHENDIANLLNGLLSQREFLQLHSCSLDSKAKTDRIFLRLGNNIAAECSLSWYSFRIDGPNPNKPENKP